MEVVFIGRLNERINTYSNDLKYLWLTLLDDKEIK